MATSNVKVLDGATATTTAPSAASDGVPLNAAWGDMAVLVKNTAGSGGSLSVTLKVWVYHPEADDWFPLGTHATAASRGILNEGNAIDEISANVIRHTERIIALKGYTRIDFQVTAISGTDNAIDAWLVRCPGEGN